MVDVIAEKVPHLRLRVLISPETARELIDRLNLLSLLAGDGGMLTDDAADAARVVTMFANDLESGLARLAGGHVRHPEPAWAHTLTSDIVPDHGALKTPVALAITEREGLVVQDVLINDAVTGRCVSMPASMAAREQAVAVAKDIVAQDKPDLDKDHVEWVVRVFHTTSGVRQAVAISRPFSTEAKARDFYGRTTNVHRAKAARGSAEAYDVVLAVQDARKWKKDRGFTELEHVVCRPNEER